MEGTSLGDSIQAIIFATVDSTIESLQLKGFLLNSDELAEYHELKKYQDEKFLTGRAASKRLGISPGAITLLRQRRKLPAKRVGRRFMYSSVDIEEYLRKQNINSKAI